MYQRPNLYQKRKKKAMKNSVVQRENQIFQKKKLIK